MGATAGNEPRPVTIEVQQFKFAVKPHPFRVAPKYGEGGQFVFENNTPVDLDVDFLRDDLIRNAQGQFITAMAVKHESSSEQLTVNLDLPSGRYPYQVLVQFGVALQPGFEATGGSRPEVEIRK